MGAKRSKGFKANFLMDCPFDGEGSLRRNVPFVVGLVIGWGDYAWSLWPGTWQVPRESCGKRVTSWTSVDLECGGDC